MLLEATFPSSDSPYQLICFYAKEAIQCFFKKNTCRILKIDAAARLGIECRLSVLKNDCGGQDTYVVKTGKALLQFFSAESCDDGSLDIVYISHVPIDKF